VEGLALAAGVPTPQIFVLHDQSINAFATGRNPKHGTIAVTEGALQQLDKLELEGVIGHEMSHIKDYDILVGSVSAVLVGMIVMVADWIRRGSFRRSFDVARRRGAGFILFAVIAAILAPLAAVIISYAVSREREYMADAQSVLLTRYPAGLIGALGKIKGESFIPEEHNRALYH